MPASLPIPPLASFARRGTLRDLAARADLNGKPVNIVKWIEPKERYACEVLAADGSVEEKILVKPDRLIFEESSTTAAAKAGPVGAEDVLRPAADTAETGAPEHMAAVPSNLQTPPAAVAEPRLQSQPWWCFCLPFGQEQLPLTVSAA